MGESIGSRPNSQEESKSLENYFNELCPYLMAIGMSYDEFWYKEPSLVKTFLKTHEIRQKQLNEQLWLGGYYNFIGISYALSNAFAKKGTRPLSYPKEPLSLSYDEQEERLAKQRNNNLLRLKEKLNSMVKNK